MKVLKILALLALLGIGTCAALPAFLPSGGWHVEVSTYIKAPSDKVFAQVADVSSWSGWNAMWSEHGGSMKAEGEGVGATVQWTSEGSTGTFTIASIVPGEKVSYTVSMEDEAGLGSGSFEFHPDGDNTTLIWKEDGDFVIDGEKIEGGVGGYFLRYMSFALQSGLEAGYGESLRKLRDLLQEMPGDAGAVGGEAEPTKER